MKNDEKATELEKVETKVYMDARLFKIASDNCAARGAYLSDLVAELLANHFERPDLAKVPRKRVGRKTGKAKKSKK